MVLRADESVAATAEEAAALRQLMEFASDLSKASLLQLLRRCGNDPNVAAEQLHKLTSAHDGEDHMSRYGSSQYEVVDDAFDADADGGADDAGPYEGANEAADGGSEDDDAPRRSSAGGAKAIERCGQISATYKRATITMGGLINLGLDLDGAPVYSFINEGIRMIDVPLAPNANCASGDAVVDAVVVKLDLAMMDDDAFQAICDSWLMEQYSSSSGSDTENEYDYGAGGDFSTALLKKLPANRSDPTEFRAYLNALLNESPAERAQRIEQERLDDFLAQELYEAELRAFEEKFQRGAVPSDKLPAVVASVPQAVAPPASARPAADRAAGPYDYSKNKPQRDRKQAKNHRWLEEEMRYLREGRAPTVGADSAAVPAGQVPGPDSVMRFTSEPAVPRAPKERISQLQIAKCGPYSSKTVQVLLPASVHCVAIQNIVNPELERRFVDAANKLRFLGHGSTVDIAYHGTNDAATTRISHGGFIAPLGDVGAGIGHRSGNSGFYGNGIYLTPKASVAQGYSDSGRIIVCNVLRGRAYRCPGLAMGSDLKRGYGSHESPCGSEWVFFSAAQVLPVAVIHFGTRSVSAPTQLGTIHSSTVADRSALPVSSTATAAAPTRIVPRAPSAAKPATGTMKAQHLSNKDRKILNRINRGRHGQQQQQAAAAAAASGRRRR